MPDQERTPDYSADFGDFTVNLYRDGQTIRAAVSRLDLPIGTLEGPTTYTDLGPHWIDIARDALSVVLIHERDAPEAQAKQVEAEREAARINAEEEAAPKADADKRETSPRTPATPTVHAKDLANKPQ